MSSVLPINIDDLLHSRVVESSRIEFKASWDEKSTAYQILKTICAFANDLHNHNGGYIVLGVEEEDGKAVLPPKGLNSEELDSIQKKIQGLCNRIEPRFYPVLSPEIVNGKHILVLWAQASDNKPHRAPYGQEKEKKYWVRLGSETVDAELKPELLHQLIQQTARVPFDSRRSHQARLEDLSETKVREFLHDIRSDLLDEPSAEEIYRRMRITSRVNDHEVPLNAGLLFFTNDPEKWFPGARIDTVQFTGDRPGDIQEERTFRGPIHIQIRDCLTYLNNLSTTHIEKQQNDIQVRGWVSYPLPVLREALVNAVYHRGYDSPPEPIKVCLFLDRIEITSYPGPVAGIEPEHLKAITHGTPPVPARNRLVGDFLKKLRLAEGWGTGVPKIFREMKTNGSPEPRFDFDSDRTYFRAILPAHPEYVAISAMRDAAHLRAVGNPQEALIRLEEAYQAHPESASLTTELIRLYAERDSVDRAETLYFTYREKGNPDLLPHVLNMMVNAYFECGKLESAKKLLNQMPLLISGSESVNAAILARRLGEEEAAHRYFEKAGNTVLSDARALLEYAQTKIKLANNVFHNHRKNNKFRLETNKRFLNEARQLLERVIQLEDSPARHAWAWFELGRVLSWLKAPKHEIVTAFQKAHELLPDEPRFKESLEKFNKSSDT